MKVGSLFSGIGGFDLAAQWMGWQTAWFSEIDPYASSVLKKHWPKVPNYGDITKINGKEIEAVDIVCGGFPCQDISIAGRGGGITGARSGLWTEFARIIEEKAPSWAVIENSPMLRSRGFDTVLKDLHKIGYDAEWHCIPASSAGAPHQRDRIWIVAYPRYRSGRNIRAIETRKKVSGERPTHNSSINRPSSERTNVANSTVIGLESSEPKVPRLDLRPFFSRTSRPLSNASREGLEGYSGDVKDWPEWAKEERPASEKDIRAGAYPAGWWITEPNIRRVVNGLPSRMDRIRCLGNAIVPQVAYFIFKAISIYEAK